MSPSYSPIYRLPFANAGETTSSTMERIRYVAIDRQLEALFTFLGDGVITGWEINASPTNRSAVIVTPGSGVVQGYAVSTNIDSVLFPTFNGNADTINYIYVSVLSHTPHTSDGEITVTTVKKDDTRHLILGWVKVFTNGRIQINDDASSGRKPLSLLRYLLQNIAQHVHNGSPGESSKIDLFNHVQGILSAANIEDMPASKITSGVFSKERFYLDHGDLSDIGTLSHSEIDNLIEKFQGVNALLFGDAMTSNLMQLVLSLKHIWANIDEYFYNFFTLIPGIGNNTFGNADTFIDHNATTAEVDYLNHKIKGKYVPSKEIGQYVINSINEFSTNGITPGETTYDSRYISVKSNSTDTYAYGWGWGYGEGLDYFDVISAASGEGDLQYGVTGDLTGYGWADMDGTLDWESRHVNSYGFGYGYEHLPKYENTLYSTNITLVGNTSYTEIHNRMKIGAASDIYNVPLNGSIVDNSINASTPNDRIFKFLKLNCNNAIVNNKRGIVSLGPPNITSDLNGFYYGKTEKGDGGEDTTLSRQASNYIVWKTPLDLKNNNNLYFEFSQVLYYRDKSFNKVDLGGEYNFFQTYDPYWAFDIGMDLIIESTVSVDTAGGNVKYRFFYKYSLDANTPFINIHDNKVFSGSNSQYTLVNYPNADNNVPALVRANASIEMAKLTKIGAYQVPLNGSIEVSVSDIAFMTSLGSGYNLSETQILSNITGIYLYTENDLPGVEDSNTIEYGFGFEKQKAAHINWPQGQKFRKTSYSSNYEWNVEEGDGGLKYEINSDVLNLPIMATQYPVVDDVGALFYGVAVEETLFQNLFESDDPSYSRIKTVANDYVLKEADEYRESKMLVDLVRVYNGKDSKFNFDKNTNSIQDIVLNFTEPVDFNSISWVSTEPSDSLVYLQIMRLSNGFEEGETDYNEAVVYTNKSEKLTQVILSNRDYWFPDGIPEMRISGSDFLDDYKSIRSISIKAVLLPSFDQQIAPVLNSITVNYTSNTQAGDLHISSANQWETYITSDNIVTKRELVEGSVHEYLALDVPATQNLSIGRVKNLLYGTKGAVVEHGTDGFAWTSSVKTYTGNGSDGRPALPKTYYQEMFSGGKVGIDGYVTCIKRLSNGDIVFLDQYSYSFGSRIVWLDRNYNLKKLILAEPAERRSSVSATIPYTYKSEARVVKAVFNPDQGDYGVLYVVFSHELLSYFKMISNSYANEKVEDDVNVYTPHLLTTNHARFVDLSKMEIRYKGTSYTFDNGVSRVIPCTRGTLCLVLKNDLSNLIKSLVSPEMVVQFAIKQVTVDGVAYNAVQNAKDMGSCVSFFAHNGEDSTPVVANTTLYRVQPYQENIRIEKPDYEVIYAPIEGTVSFDIDSSGMIYILKESVPYVKDAIYKNSGWAIEPWYVSFDSSRYWKGWMESTRSFMSKNVSVFKSLPSNYYNMPDFYLGDSFWGLRGCIQKKDDYLLITISGDKNNSISGTYSLPSGKLLLGRKVFVFKKITSTGKYGPPAEPIDFTESQWDGLYPMAARFDESTYDDVNKEYGYIYIALSDLKIASGSGKGLSKVIKVDENRFNKVVSEWGSEVEYVADNGMGSYALTINDVFPLSYKKDGYTPLESGETEVIISS